MSVETFGQYGTVQLMVSTTANVKEIFATLMKQLKVKNTSEQHFSLYCGTLGQPKLKLTGSETDQVDGSLCLQRCGMEPNKELKVIKSDDIAVHLLYSEANYYFNQPISKLRPTPDQRQLLQEYSDPQFPTERQFLETIINVKGYSATQANNCKLKVEIQHKNMTLSINTIVACTCYEDTLEIMEHSTNTVLQWNWTAVKQWKLNDDNEACFEVCNEKGNAGILEWIALETDQAQLLLQSAHETCTHLLYKIHPEMKPVNYVRLGRSVDPVYEYINNLFFGHEMRFTSLR